MHIAAEKRNHSFLSQPLCGFPCLSVLAQSQIVGIDLDQYAHVLNPPENIPIALQRSVPFRMGQDRLDCITVLQLFQSLQNHVAGFKSISILQELYKSISGIVDGHGFFRLKAFRCVFRTIDFLAQIQVHAHFFNVRTLFHGQSDLFKSLAYHMEFRHITVFLAVMRCCNHIPDTFLPVCLQ